MASTKPVLFPRSTKGRRSSGRQRRQQQQRRQEPSSGQIFYVDISQDSSSDEEHGTRVDATTPSTVSESSQTQCSTLLSPSSSSSSSSTSKLSSSEIKRKTTSELFSTTQYLFKNAAKGTNVERDILHHLQPKLKLSKEATGVVDRTPNVLQLVESIYNDNQKMAKESNEFLRKYGPPMDVRPLYVEPSDTAVYHENKRKNALIKPHLAKKIIEQKQKEREEYERLLQMKEDYEKKLQEAKEKEEYERVLQMKKDNEKKLQEMKRKEEYERLLRMKKDYEKKLQEAKEYEEKMRMMEERKVASVPNDEYHDADWEEALHGFESEQTRTNKYTIKSKNRKNSNSSNSNSNSSGNRSSSKRSSSANSSDSIISSDDNA